jgi:acetylornithine/N-succinyldiaminopimelate aminotransferase
MKTRAYSFPECAHEMLRRGYMDTFEQVRSTENRYQLNTYNKLPISIERGEGVWVYDSEGRKYLDLYGGHAVALTGHCHPAIVNAVKAQAEKLIFYSNVVYSSVRARAAKAIIEIAPRGMDKVFFCNSGAEANETAMKIARRYTGKRKIIAMKNGFHGRTAGALGATALGNYRAQFYPVLEDFIFADFGSIRSLEQSMNDDVAGVILEPIQSMAGVEMADDEYYVELRNFCAKNGTVLVFDEVQTGFGRTGNWFFGDHFGVSPDIITLAKGIGGGIPVGGVIIKEEIAKTIGPGEHGSTFGGGPIASAAVEANIGIIREENLVHNARDTGEYLAARVADIPLVKRVRGRGLLVGIELDRDAAEVRDFLLAHGIITGTASLKNVLRLLPPIMVKKPEIDIFVEALGAFRS